jgi:hypothetical protein
MTTDADQPLSKWDKLAWLGTMVIALLCLSRAMVEHDPFPWWSSDPFVFSPPITGLTPRWALLFNAVLMGSAAVTLWAHLNRGFSISKLDAVLIALGLGAISYHMFIDLERTLDASTIGAVVCVLVTISSAHTLRGGIRVLSAAILTMPMMLVCVGLYEVYVSHPETLRIYEQTRDSFLAARGWSEGSFEALSYERRLRNPEPLAWFGLTNVFASFVAAGAAALFTLAISHWKNDRNRAGLFAMGGFVCAFGVFLCASKGGYALLLVGLLLGAMITLSPTKRLNGKAIIALCVVVLLGLTIRGFIGESLGERSLLFRSQYLAGSINIWLENPLLGAGPGMFQEQYTLLKPELSPEDVATPHSVWFAWLATLGLGGIALITHLIRSIASTSIQSGDDFIEPSSTEWTSWTKLALVLTAIPMLFSLRMQDAVLSAAELGPLMIGLMLWITSAVVFVRLKLSESQIRTAVFVFASVLMIHAMIEVTGTLIVSAPLWALGLGLCIKTKKSAIHTKTATLITLLAITVSTVIALVRWVDFNRWEQNLHLGAREASSIAQIHSALNALEYSQTPQNDIQQISQMLSGLIDQPVSASFDSIIPALNQAEFVARTQSIDRLDLSLAARPTHSPTRIAISQQLLWLASLNQSLGYDAQATQYWDRATGLFENGLFDTKAERWASSIWAGRVSAFPDAPERDVWLRTSFLHAQQAFSGTPHDSKLALRLMELAIELDETESARSWAQEAVDIHQRMRLDPLRGLNPSELGRAKAILGE